MLALVKRNIKIYFRNKGAWLASLLTVFIIIGLYALFSEINFQKVLRV